jgi:hypothetical protein
MEWQTVMKKKMRNIAIIRSLAGMTMFHCTDLFSIPKEGIRTNIKYC